MRLRTSVSSKLRFLVRPACTSSRIAVIYIHLEIYAGGVSVSAIRCTAQVTLEKKRGVYAAPPSPPLDTPARRGLAHI